MTGPRRIAVFGGRDFCGRWFIWTSLDRVLRRGPMVLVHGACAFGADAHADVWAQSREVPTEPYPAQWREGGKSAGPRRNREMAESRLDGAVEFPGARGTADMRAQCERMKVPIWRPRFHAAALRGLHEIVTAPRAMVRREDVANPRAVSALRHGLAVVWVGRLSSWWEPSEVGWRIAVARKWAERPEKRAEPAPEWRRYRWENP